MVGVGSAQAILEVVNEGCLGVSQVDPVKVSCLNLQIRVVEVLNVLELVVANLRD